MKEAQITCTCRSIQVQDLGLDLRSGQMVYVDVAAAEGSADLALAAKSGGVKVRHIERCQVRRPASSPLLHHPPSPPVRLEDWEAASFGKSPGIVKVKEEPKDVSVVEVNSSPSTVAAPTSGGATPITEPHTATPSTPSRPTKRARKG